VSELHTRLREILAALSASDPTCKRFGAAQHQYALLPPLEAAPVEGLPEDYVDYVTRFSSGGVGPYYGLLPADRAANYLVTAPATVTAWKRALPIAHLGCGYAAVLPLDGPASGQIWLDARQLGIVTPIRASFTAFYLDWIDRVANSQWLEAFVPVGACAITSALSGYLGLREQELGIPAGSLDGEALRTVLGDLGAGAIAVTTDDSPLFAKGDRVDPCIACARALQGLGEQGLRPDVVAPGVPPLPARQ
jgi:hypothetical protein